MQSSTSMMAVWTNTHWDKRGHHCHVWKLQLGIRRWYDCYSDLGNSLKVNRFTHLFFKSRKCGCTALMSVYENSMCNISFIIYCGWTQVLPPFVYIQYLLLLLPCAGVRLNHGSCVYSKFFRLQNPTKRDKRESPEKQDEKERTMEKVQ